MSSRTIAIGDIHGCFIALAALIDAIDLQPDDTLVTLGDYVDKGLDSKGVLDFLLTLETRCQLISLIGNHDAVMLGAIDHRLSIEAWEAIGGTATLQSYSESERVKDIPLEHAEFLRRCRMWYGRRRISLFMPHTIQSVYSINRMTQRCYGKAYVTMFPDLTFLARRPSLATRPRRTARSST